MLRDVHADPEHNLNRAASEKFRQVSKEYITQKPSTRGNDDIPKRRKRLAE